MYSKRPHSPAIDGAFFHWVCRTNHEQLPFLGEADASPAQSQRKAPLKLAGLFTSLALRRLMAVNREDYSAMSNAIRQLAETMSSPEERLELLEIAGRYERLAEQANASDSAKAALRLRTALSEIQDILAQAN